MGQLVFDNSYARLPEAFFARVPPHVPRAPELVVFNAGLARDLGLDPAGLSDARLAAWFSGAEPPPGIDVIRVGDLREAVARLGLLPSE